jgi:hypothetical protein
VASLNDSDGTLHYFRGDITTTAAIAAGQVEKGFQQWVEGQPEADGA